MTATEPARLEAEYDNRANVPEHPAIIAGWERDAAAYRAGCSGREGAVLAYRVPYGAHPRQALDVFQAPHPGPDRPLVVFIHGGYWRSLAPDLFSHMAAGLNAHGLSVALPGYRLCPEAAIAEIIADLRAACAALWTRFGKRLVVCGHSAGGHLAAAMVSTDWARAGGDVPPDLARRGLAVSGIFDLAPLLATSVNASLRLDEAAARAVSPALWPVPAGVRFEAWVGETETSEYHRQSRLLCERWAAAGAETRLDIVPGANHFTSVAPLAEPASAMVAALLRLCDDPAPATSS